MIRNCEYLKYPEWKCRRMVQGSELRAQGIKVWVMRSSAAVIVVRVRRNFENSSLFFLGTTRTRTRSSE